MVRGSIPSAATGNYESLGMTTRFFHVLSETHIKFEGPLTTCFPELFGPE